jgi:hypothetical protein
MVHLAFVDAFFSGKVVELPFFTRFIDGRTFQEMFVPL